MGKIQKTDMTAADAEYIGDRELTRQIHRAETQDSHAEISSDVRNGQDPGERLWHATSLENLSEILSNGMNAGSYWGRKEIADYYGETITDEGHTPILISVLLADLLAISEPEPDHAGIEEPISSVIGKKEDDVHLAWGRGEQNWHSCLTLIGSLRFPLPVPTDLLTCDEPAVSPEL